MTDNVVNETVNISGTSDNDLHKLRADLKEFYAPSLGCESISDIKFHFVNTIKNKILKCPKIDLKFKGMNKKQSREVLLD